MAMITGRCVFFLVFCQRLPPPRRLPAILTIIAADPTVGGPLPRPSFPQTIIP